MNRIKYFDGLKGILAVLICLLHYCLAILPTGYTGFGSGVETGSEKKIVMDGLPDSLFTNTSITLYVLFGLIAFFIAVGYFGSKDDKYLGRACVRRYIQFLIPVFVSLVSAFFLYKSGFLQYEKMANLTGNPWNLAIIPENVSLGRLFYLALIETYLENNTSTLTVLWCMHIIFIGSVAAYGGYALFGKFKKRYIIYLALLVLGIGYPKYLVFLGGAVCGDWYVHRKERKEVSLLQNIIGLLTTLLGIGIGLIPSAFLGTVVPLTITYALGTFLILMGILNCTWLQYLLSFSWLQVMGKYLFSIILVHIFVLYSFTVTIYPWILGRIGDKVLVFWCTFLLSAVVIGIASFVFYHCFEKPSRKLAGYVGNLLK